MKQAMLVADRVSKEFVQGQSTITVLYDVNVRFESGKTYAITGVSGSGKSTFIHLLAGLDTPTDGAIVFNGRPLNTLLSHEREQFLNQSIGLVFQSPYLIKELTVVENVMLPGLIGGNDWVTTMKNAQKFLDYVGVGHKASQKPGALSGGQQQRVALARALSNQPVFLLADEPTGNLDMDTGKAMVDLLLDCNLAWGMGIIVSTHDEYVAHSMDSLYQLVGGRLTQKA